MQSVAGQMADMRAEAAAAKTAAAAAAAPGKDTDESCMAMSGDKLQALAGVDFKRSVPTIRDEDPDLHKLDREYDNMVACCSYGTRKWRDLDILQIYRQCFLEGSTRRKVYENVCREGC